MERVLNSTEDSLESLLLIIRQLLLDPFSIWPRHCIRPFRCIASNPPSTSFISTFEVTSFAQVYAHISLIYQLYDAGKAPIPGTLDLGWPLAYSVLRQDFSSQPETKVRSSRWEHQILATRLVVSDKALALWLCRKFPTKMKNSEARIY